jgi:hypothetical protein
MENQKDDMILFYYRKRVALINQEMLDSGCITLLGQKIKLTEFIDKIYDKIPEQILNTGDPNFDENVPYILMRPSNHNLPSQEVCKRCGKLMGFVTGDDYVEPTVLICPDCLDKVRC